MRAPDKNANKGPEGFMNKIAGKTYFFTALVFSTALFCAAAQAAPARSHAAIEQIDFRDVNVGDALKILSDQSDLNIIASKKAAEIPVTMFLRRVTPMEVIEALAKTYNLWYQHDHGSNIVRIYTVEEYRLEQVEFKKEETEIFTLKNAKNALDLAETIQNLFSSRVRLSFGTQNQMQEYLELQQRFRRFDVVDGRTTQHFSASSGSSGGSQGGGGAGGGMTGGGMMGGMSGGIMGGTAGGMMGGMQGGAGYGNGQGYGQNGRQQPGDEQLNALGNAFSSLDGQGLQGGGNIVNQFAGSAEASRELIDTSVRHQAPIFVGVIKHQNRVLVRTRDLDAMNEIRAICKKLDMESSMLLMEVKILAIDLSDGFDSLFDFKLKNGDFQTSTQDRTTSELLQDGVKTAAAAFNPALLATVVSDNFEARLQLLEKENRVTQLATPILLTSNQEVSRFFVGTEIPIVTGYTPGSTNNNGINGVTVTLPPSATYTQRKVGNTLLLTPNINADNTVNIQVLVEQSSVTPSGATILVGDGGSGLTEQKIDTVSEKTFSGSVIAKDNNTVAVGGLIQEGAGNRENKVPFLGDVPLLGFFFRDEGQTRERTELVVLIKPHVINSPAEAEEISKTLMLRNSAHPNAVKDGGLDVYTNPDREHKGYKLEQPFKEYSGQDSLDRYQWDNVNPLR